MKKLYLLISVILILLLIPTVSAEIKKIGSSPCHLDTFGTDQYASVGNYCWGADNHLYYRHSTYTWSNEIFDGDNPKTYTSTDLTDGKFYEQGDPSGNNDGGHGITYSQYIDLLTKEGDAETKETLLKNLIVGNLKGADFSTKCPAGSYINEVVVDSVNAVSGDGKHLMGVIATCSDSSGTKISNTKQLGIPYNPLFSDEERIKFTCPLGSFINQATIFADEQVSGVIFQCNDPTKTKSELIGTGDQTNFNRVNCPAGQIANGLRGGVIKDDRKIYRFGLFCLEMETPPAPTPSTFTRSCEDTPIAFIGASNFNNNIFKSTWNSRCGDDNKNFAVNGANIISQKNKQLPKALKYLKDISDRKYLVVSPSGNSCSLGGKKTSEAVQDIFSSALDEDILIVIVTINPRNNHQSECTKEINKELLKLHTGEVFRVVDISKTLDPDNDGTCDFCKPGDQKHWNSEGVKKVVNQIVKEVFGKQVTPGPTPQPPTRPVTQTINQQCSDVDQCRKIDDVWLRFSPYLKINKGVYVAKQGWTSYATAYRGQPTGTTPSGPLPSISEIEALKTASPTQINNFITTKFGAPYIEDIEYMTRLLSIERGCSAKWEEERGAIGQVVLNRVLTSGKWGNTVKEVVATDGGKSWFGASSIKIQDSNRGIIGETYRGCLISAVKLLSCQGEENQGATEIGARTHFVHRCTQIASGREVPSWNYENPLQVQEEECAAHFSGKDTSARSCSSRLFRNLAPAVAQPSPTTSSGSILTIGDSHSAHYYYGKEFHQLFVNSRADINSYAVGGSSSSGWLNGLKGKARSNAGFIYTIFRDSKGQASDLSSSTTYTLKSVMGKHNPKTVIISLGTNSVSKHITNGQSAFSSAGQLAKIASTSANCIWVGPPQYKSRDLSDIQNAANSLKLVVEQNGCIFIDSTKLTDKSNMADSVHYNSVGGKAWAEKVYAKISISPSAPTTPPTTVPTTTSGEYTILPYPDALDIVKSGTHANFSKYKGTAYANGKRPADAPENKGALWVPKQAHNKKVDLIIAYHGWRSLSIPTDSIFLTIPGQQTKQKDYDKVIQSFINQNKILPIVVAAPMHDRGPKSKVWQPEVYNVNTHIQLIEKELAKTGTSISRVSLIGHSNANCGGGLARAARELSGYPLYFYGAADGTCFKNKDPNQPYDFFEPHNVLTQVLPKANILFHMHQPDAVVANKIKALGGGDDPNALPGLYTYAWKSNDNKAYTYRIKVTDDKGEKHTHTTIPTDMLLEVLPRFFKSGGIAVAGPTNPNTPQIPSNAGVAQTYKSTNNGNRKVGYLTSTNFNEAQPVQIYFYLGGQGSSIKNILSSQKTNFNTLLSGKNAIIVIPQIPSSGELNWYKTGYDKTINEIKSKLNFNSISSVRFAAHSMGGVAIQNILKKATTYTPEKIILLDACSASWCTSIAKSNIPMDVYQNKKGFGKYGRNEKQITSELGGFSHVTINVVTEGHNTIPIKYLTKIN